MGQTLAKERKETGRKRSWQVSLPPFSSETSPVTQELIVFS